MYFQSKMNKVAPKNISTNVHHKVYLMQILYPPTLPTEESNFFKVLELSYEIQHEKNIIFLFFPFMDLYD